MPDRPEVRLNENGTLDEIVATNASIHLEQMDDNFWWMSIEANGVTVDVNLRSKRKIKAKVYPYA